MTRAKPNSSKFLLRGVSSHKTTHSQPKRAKKKGQKEVRKSNGAYQSDFQNVINPRNTKKAFFKMRGKEIEKQIKAKKTKLHSHRSHNTTPGEITDHTQPQSFHVEGKRWIKTIQKQVKDQAKKLTKHLMKKF